ncbi:MAG: serine protease [Anaerolineales bacterium]|nr:serine protease [Anaerolineales bacterium]
MPQDLSTFIVGIKNKHGEIVGTGFVVADQVIVTCAHVLRNNKFQLGDQVITVFSALDVDYPTSFSREGYHPDNDIAILISDQPLPLGVTPALLCSPDEVEYNSEFYTIGYRKLGRRGGVGAGGKFLGGIQQQENKYGQRVRYPDLTLQSQQITEGMSGAPLYIISIDRVVGIISLFWDSEKPEFKYKNKDRDTAFAKPVEAIIEAWPALQLHSSRLTWEKLRSICAAITQKEMGALEKGRAELYLRREKVYETFEQFLKSDKRCFVLRGKSGSGKSSFLVSLREELQQSRDDLAVLMYNGQSIIGASITDVVTDYFESHLLESKLKLKEKNLWFEIPQIDGIEKYSILLCIDAINEHAQAKELLRQLNDLVKHPWPWLKIVITTRSEAWQIIQEDQRLADTLYYREENSGKIGFEMPLFSSQELPEVYEKYRQKFQLQTKYEDLSVSSRKILEDSFNLFLAANNKDKVIPAQLKAIKLIEDYINNDQLLKPDDRLFLRNKLMPLMIDKEIYHNEVPYNDAWKVNQTLISITRLVDADILRRDEKRKVIAFKYERFYDYFGGEYLVELAKNAEKDGVPLSDFYLEHIYLIDQYPFLWGVVENALVQELIKDSSGGLIIQLSYIPERMVKEMVVKVLITYGQDEPTYVQAILKQLIG